MIELRVIKSIEQMNRARTGSGEAHADFAGKFRVATRHERGHFFVARLDKFNFMIGFFRAFERAHNSVDAIAGIAEDAPDAPLMKSLDQKITAIFELDSCQKNFGEK
jgi:hypothetical protein